MSVSIAGKDIMQRRQEIVRMIAPLVSDRNRIEVGRIGAGRDLTLGLLAKGQSPSSVHSVDSIRVPSGIPGIFLNYHEVWTADRASSDYLLDRAYLNVHLKRSPEAQDKQILCLHCDPHLSRNDASFLYKRGPHLHVGGATPNIDRAHVGVCLRDPHLGGSDLATMMSTMKSAFVMIGNEIFPHYRRA